MTSLIKKNEKKAFKRNIWSLISVIYICILLFAGIFGDMGFLKNYKLYKQNKKIEANINELEIKNRDLRREIDNLKGNTRYIEKIAREELNMSRQDEITFIFEGKRIKSGRE